MVFTEAIVAVLETMVMMVMMAMMGGGVERSQGGGVKGWTSNVEVATPHSLFLVGHLILTAI